MHVGTKVSVPKGGNSEGGPILESFKVHTGVCEINTHPTFGQCRTPPIPPNVNVHGHAQGECNRSVCLLAAVGHLSANFEIRGAGSGH